MAEFEIKVSELDSGGKWYAFPLTRVWLGGVLVGLPERGGPLRVDPAVGDGEVSVWAEKSGSDVLIRARVRAHLVTDCARCLGEARIAVDTTWTVLYAPRGKEFRPVCDEDELSPEELEREFYTGEHIVLDALVREHVLLEVPMKTLCSEGCPGIEVPESVRGPADFGLRVRPDSSTIDPRLAPLLGFVERFGGSAGDPSTGPVESAGDGARKGRAAGPTRRGSEGPARPRRSR